MGENPLYLGNEYVCVHGVVNRRCHRSKHKQVVTAGGCWVLGLGVGAGCWGQARLLSETGD